MKKYLICYDYGTGGVWKSLLAESKQLILVKYPEFNIVESKPAWMDDNQYSDIMAMPLRLDDENNEFLNAIINDRST